MAKSGPLSPARRGSGLLGARLWSKTQPQRVGIVGTMNRYESPSPRLRPPSPPPKAGERAGRGGVFMENPVSVFFRMHWDHGTVWAIQSDPGPAHSQTWRKFARLW